MICQVYIPKYRPDKAIIQASPNSALSLKVCDLRNDDQVKVLWQSHSRDKLSCVTFLTR